MKLYSVANFLFKRLSINKSENNIESRTERFFITFCCILRQDGLTLIIEENTDLVVKEVLGTSRPHLLKSRPECVLDLSN